MSVGVPAIPHVPLRSETVTLNGVSTNLAQFGWNLYGN